MFNFNIILPDKSQSVLLPLLPPTYFFNPFANEILNNASLSEY